MSETATYDSSGVETSSGQEAAEGVAESGVETSYVPDVFIESGEAKTDSSDVAVVNLPEDGLFAVISGSRSEVFGRLLENDLTRQDSSHGSIASSEHEDPTAQLELAIEQINSFLEQEASQGHEPSTQLMIGRRFQEGGQDKLAIAGAGDVELGRLRGDEYQSTSPTSDQDAPEGLTGQAYNIKKGVVNLEPGDRVVFYTGNVDQPLGGGDFSRMLGSEDSPQESAEHLLQASQSAEKGKAMVVFDNPENVPGVSSDAAETSSDNETIDTSRPELAREAGLTPEEWAREYINKRVALHDSSIPETLVPAGDLYENQELVEATHRLADAREQLAEASVNVRRSSLWFNSSRREQALEEATEHYQQVREEFIQMQLDIAEDMQADLAQLRTLMAELISSEAGAKIGGIVNDYKNNETKKHNRLVEWYQNSRVARIAAGVGSAAVVGVLGATGGLAAGGAVAGAAVFGRVGRIYLNRGARHSEGYRSEEEIERTSALETYNQEDFEADYQDLQNYQKRGESGQFESITTGDLVREGGRRLDDREQEADLLYRQALAEAESETKTKRKSLAWAIGGAAVGAGIGRFIEIADVSWDEYFGGEVDPEDLSPQAEEQIDQLQERANDLQERAEDLQAEKEQLQNQVESLQEAGGAEDAAAEISERAKYLYGDLAGEDISVTISEEGELIWDKLEEKVGDRPDKQRIVGNIVKKMEDKYGSFKLKPYSAGDSFKVSLTK